MNNKIIKNLFPIIMDNILIINEQENELNEQIN